MVNRPFGLQKRVPAPLLGSPGLSSYVIFDHIFRAQEYTDNGVYNLQIGVISCYDHKRL